MEQKINLQKLKVVSILFLFLFTQKSIADEHKGKFSYVFTSPNYKLGVVYAPLSTSGRPINVSQTGKTTYESKFGYSFGAIGSYRIKGNSFIETGITHQVQILKYSQLPSDAFISDLNALSRSIDERFNSISIPIKMLFYNSNYRFRKYITPGIALNMMYAQQQHETYYFENNYTISHVNKNKGGYRILAPEIRMGFGWEFDANIDLSFKIEPYIGATLFRGKSKVNMLSLGLMIVTQIQE
jgi:hypothetical protein